MKKKSQPETRPIEDDLDAIAEGEALDNTEFDPESIPEPDDELDGLVTVTDLEAQPPPDEHGGDELTADTLMGDPRDEKPLAADEEPPTIPRRLKPAPVLKDRRSV